MTVVVASTRAAAWAVALVLVLGVSAPAAAGSPGVVQVSGSGRANTEDVTGKRSVRGIALDRAFADALGKQLRRELTVTEQRRARAGIEREILRRARLYVRSYKVTREADLNPGVELVVVVSIDRDKLIAALGKLGVADLGKRRARPRTRSMGSRPSIALVLHASRGGRIDTSFGARGGNGGPAGVALASQLRALGFDLVAATGATAAASTNAQADLPVGDSAAIALARSVGAGGVVVVGVSVAQDGRVRATSLHGAAGRAAVRVIDVATGNLVVAARIREAGFGASAQAALDATAAALGRSLGERLGAKMGKRWPSGIVAPRNGRLVVVRGAHRWASVMAVIKRLRAIPGAGGVTLRRLRQASVAMVVDTRLSAAQVAGQLGRVGLPLGTASTRASGSRVEVLVDGDQGGSD